MDDQPPTPRSNRRLTARRACKLTVRYKTGEGWHPATAMDLSHKGCRLRLGEDLARGGEVTVVFETPDGSGGGLEVEIPGQVIWSRREGLSHQAGIHFAEPPPALSTILARA
ncbi:MAG: PilZ domain-containing protein [Vicinamibacteria bacterium]